MDIRKNIRDTRAEIDLEKLRYNYRELKKYLSEGTEVAAVVKANGYGHGAIEVGRVFYEEGAKYLAVANFSEGIELKNADSVFPVLVMGYTQDNQLEYAVRRGLVLTVFTIEQAKLIDKYSRKSNMKTRIHLKINTGFNRLGMSPEDKTIEIIEEIFRLGNIVIEGVFTHLALTGKEKDKVQFDLFKKFNHKLEKKGINIPIKHICDSLGAIRYPEYHLEMVRAGAILYGYYNGESPIKLKPAMELKSRISTINIVEKDRGVSYDYLYTVDKKSKIAVVPVGYADGYPRNIWKKGKVLVCGKRAKIAGIICMDQLMVDVTEVKDVVKGDDVTLWGDKVSLQEISELTGTNKNDLMSSISRRVPRVYKEGKKLAKIKDYLIGEWEV